jgi:hypothetical protein
MLTEDCVACGADVPLSDAVHMLVNPKDDSEVVDGYLCRSCYQEHVEPILPDDEEGPVETDATDDAPDDATPGEA